MSELSAKQRQILEYMKAEVREKGYPPSVREICDAVGLKSTGNITAGTPILAVENIEDTFPIPVDYIHNDTVFMLRVKGESMIEAGIFDKDLILVRQQQDANNGDIVVALIEDFATVKTFYKEKDFIRLQPENPSMSPIIVKDVAILGKVIGLFRKF